MLTFWVSGLGDVGIQPATLGLGLADQALGFRASNRVLGLGLPKHLWVRGVLAREGGGRNASLWFRA